jgi:hypothetical protein
VPVPQLDLSGRTLGDFRIGQLLGRGAHGWVFRAEQISLDRAVALKVLDPSVALDPDAARRFIREGRSAAKLDHPAILDVYHAGVADGLHFLAMRLVDGPSLADLLAARQPRDPAATMIVLSSIAAALDHAHVRGVVHRDVKPSNILLEHGDPRRAWLGDFGIAVTVNVSGALSTAVLGTAAYMAPEQVDPSRIGPATDQYALGCVAYEALTGRLPFVGDDLVAMLLSHARNPVPPTGSAALDAVFGRVLAKDPNQRYPSVTEFSAELGHALHQDGPPATAPTQVPIQVRDPVRRRRWWSIGAAVAVILAAGAGLAVWLDGSGGPATPQGWTAVSGPGPVHYAVPDSWQRGDSTATVVTYLGPDSTTALVVSSAPPQAADPSTSLQQVFSCTPSAIEVAGHPAASCQAGDGERVVISNGATDIELVFTGAAASTEVTTLLSTITISG